MLAAAGQLDGGVRTRPDTAVLVFLLHTCSPLQVFIHPPSTRTAHSTCTLLEVTQVTADRTKQS